MRKACIELHSTMKYAALNAGPLGGGKCLFMIVLSNNLEAVIPAEKWNWALQECIAKAEELKYEVAHIYGKSLAESNGA
ncbi:hypothetical protein J9236_04500 [Providencia rettgeri]|uniref:hypothetical protein n=2 Tax=Providencia TaxID=586 RepID=UPI001B398F5F|nr:hypothetical protein [Providencia rettgeri]MBQ0340497.1 hypothetical protein [Providencia rettgeri]